jgi:hypothetical protein
MVFKEFMGCAIIMGLVTGITPLEDIIPICSCPDTINPILMGVVGVVVAVVVVK